VKPLVKICGLADSVAVQAAVEAGAGAVGFVFADSVRRISPADAARLAANLPTQIKRVAVMLHPSNEQWLEVRDVFKPDILQTDLTDFEYLDVTDDFCTWPVLREGIVSADDPWPETFVYEGKASGKGQRVDWQVAAQHARRGRMVLAGGLNCDNVREAVETVAPYAVDVSSGVESAPGIKDVRLIRAFIEAAFSAFAADSKNEEGEV
jgi:phosphoribosylanthranilate isomerase